jgi:hypothetical protein
LIPWPIRFEVDFLNRAGPTVREEDGLGATIVRLFGRSMRFFDSNICSEGILLEFVLDSCCIPVSRFVMVLFAVVIRFVI